MVLHDAADISLEMGESGLDALGIHGIRGRAIMSEDILKILFFGLLEAAILEVRADLWALVVILE